MIKTFYVSLTIIAILLLLNCHAQREVDDCKREEKLPDLGPIRTLRTLRRAPWSGSVPPSNRPSRTLSMGQRWMPNQPEGITHLDGTLNTGPTVTTGKRTPACAQTVIVKCIHLYKDSTWWQKTHKKTIQNDLNPFFFLGEGGVLVVGTIPPPIHLKFKDSCELLSITRTPGLIGLRPTLAALDKMLDV